MITLRLLAHGIGTLPAKHLPTLPRARHETVLAVSNSELRAPSSELPNRSEIRDPRSEIREDSELRVPSSELPNRSEINQSGDQTPCTLQVVDQDLPSMLRMLSDRAHV